MPMSNLFSSKPGLSRSFGGKSRFRFPGFFNPNAWKMSLSKSRPFLIFSGTLPSSKKLGMKPPAMETLLPLAICRFIWLTTCSLFKPFDTTLFSVDEFAVNLASAIPTPPFLNNKLFSRLASSAFSIGKSNR